MWSDRETQHDCLGFERYVEVLSEICTHGDLAPLTLGIFGSWGSGKTSLMRMLQHKLTGLGGGVTTLWFNAWRYEGREEAQSALIHAILAKLSDGKTLAEDTKSVLNRLKEGASVLKLAKFITKTAITLTPDLQGFINCFKEESEAVAETMERFDDDFSELLRTMQVKHIIVFIDDLDRCSSQKVIETFETIKLFLNTPACTFVIGADAAKIEDAVGEVYQVSERQRRKDYLEKIVQLPFAIPVQSLGDISCYVGMLVMARHIDPTVIGELVSARGSFYQGDNVVSAILRWPNDNTALFGNRLAAVREELADIMPYVDVLGHGLKGNPRQIKRFLNIISLRRKLAKINNLQVEPAELIKLAVIEYVWDEFFNSVVDTIDPKTGCSALIAEMLKLTNSGKEASDSPLVTESLQHGGLVEFLMAEPKVDGKLDLNPYLFLAQTSLTNGGQRGLVSVDDRAKKLARLIETEDRLRSKTAANQTAQENITVATAVVRTLLGNLPQANTTVQTLVLNAIGIICKSHTVLFATVVKSLTKFDAQQREAVALAAATLLTSAEKSGTDVPADLKNRLVSQSKLAAAFNPSGTRGGQRKGDGV